MATVFNIKNEAFAGFVFYGALVMGKTIGMSLVTGAFRKIRGSLPTPEDAKVMAPNDKEKQKKLLQPDEKVERVRKAHLNDLENTLPFGLIGLLYLSTGPSTATALWHFRIFFWGRLLHSLAYIGGVSRPRGIGFMMGFVVNVSMVVQTLLAVC